MKKIKQKQKQKTNRNRIKFLYGEVCHAQPVALITFRRVKPVESHELWCLSIQFDELIEAILYYFGHRNFILVNQTVMTFCSADININ